MNIAITWTDYEENSYINHRNIQLGVVRKFDETHWNAYKDDYSDFIGQFPSREIAKQKLEESYEKETK